MTTKSGAAWGVAAVVVGALLMLSRKKGGGSGASKPGGSIGEVTVSQGARMGAHLVAKDYANPVTVSVRAIGNTKNAAGSLIAWPYLVRYRVNQAASGAMVEEASQTLTMVNQSEEIYTFGYPSYSVAWYALPTGRLSVVARLWARKSAADGTPMPDAAANWQEVANLEHPNAIQWTASGGADSLDRAVTGLTVVSAPKLNTATGQASVAVKNDSGKNVHLAVIARTASGQQLARGKFYGPIAPGQTVNLVAQLPQQPTAPPVLDVYLGGAGNTQWFGVTAGVVDTAPALRLVAPPVVAGRTLTLAVANEGWSVGYAQVNLWPRSYLQGVFAPNQPVMPGQQTTFSLSLPSGPAESATLVVPLTDSRGGRTGTVAETSILLPARA